MKSNTQQLESRGYIFGGIENKLHTSFQQRIELLKSKQPAERTLGAKLLFKHTNILAIEYLINALKIETKLYSKIEICNSLVSYGKDSLIPLIGILGKIGNNQHRVVPDKEFKKNNYPLPRDIAGRTLSRIGLIALPALIEELDKNDLNDLSEVIDTIGFICFYDYQPFLFGLLIACFERNSHIELIKWKIFRSMSACPESVSFLNEQKLVSSDSLKLEIDRSLSIIVKRK